MDQALLSIANALRRKQTNKVKEKYLYNDSFQSGNDDDGKSDLPKIKEELIEEFDDESPGEFEVMIECNEADNEQRSNLQQICRGCATVLAPFQNGNRVSSRISGSLKSP